MTSLLDHEVLLVTGKGGVGKSTVAVTLARAAAAGGRKTLLVEFESVSRAGPLFGLREPGTEPVQVAERLWLRGFRTLDSLNFFALQQLRLRALARMVMRNDTVRGFFMAMPAIKSVTFLYHLWRLVEERGRGGDGTWDLVVCDLPTTGFIMGLYGVPAMVRQIFHAGPLARTAQGMSDFLYGVRRTGLVVVTLPEEMPIAESIEFLEALRARYGVAPVAMVVNGVYPDLLSWTELAELRAACAEGADAGLEGLCTAATTVVGRHERAGRLEPLLRAAIAAPVLRLPHLFARSLPLSAIDQLATAISAQLEGGGPEAAAESGRSLEPGREGPWS